MNRDQNPLRPLRMYLQIHAELARHNLVYQRYVELSGVEGKTKTLAENC